MHIQQMTVGPNHVAIKSQGRIRLRAATRMVTVYNGHGLLSVLELSAAAPVGSRIVVRRRNDYAGSVVSAVFGAATFAIPAHTRQITLERTASSYSLVA